MSSSETPSGPCKESTDTSEEHSEGPDDEVDGVIF